MALFSVITLLSAALLLPATLLFEGWKLSPVGLAEMVRRGVGCEFCEPNETKLAGHRSGGQERSTGAEHRKGLVVGGGEAVGEGFWGDDGRRGVVWGGGGGGGRTIGRRLCLCGVGRTGWASIP